MVFGFAVAVATFLAGGLASIARFGIGSSYRQTWRVIRTPLSIEQRSSKLYGASRSHTERSGLRSGAKVSRDNGEQRPASSAQYRPTSVYNRLSLLCTRQGKG
jgi:hypothetical protein